MLHLLAARSHLAVSGLLAAAFLLTGLIQVGAVATTRRWPARTREAIAFVDLAAIGAWVTSRTVGLPLSGLGVESVGTADVVTVILEAAAVALLLGSPRLVAARRGAAASLALVVSLAAVAVAAPTSAHTHAATHGASHAASDADDGGHGEDDHEHGPAPTDHGH